MQELYPHLVKDLALKNLGENIIPNAFVLLELVIVIAVLALIAGGGFYIKGQQGEPVTIQRGIDAESKAEEVVDQISKRGEKEQNAIQELNPKTASTTSISKPTPSSKPVLE